MNTDALIFFSYATYAGLIYAIIWWTLKIVDPTEEDRLFDILSVLVTICIAAAVADILLYIFPHTMTYGGVIIMLIVGAITAVFRKAVITIYRKIEL